MKFGENFTFYRKKLGMTQEEIAERLFVSRQTVSRWENGSVVPDAQTLIQICDFFDCDMDILLRRDAAEADSFHEKSSESRIQNYNESYDLHMNRYAFFIALGVALILIGVTLMIFLSAYERLELLSVIVLFSFIFCAVAIFVLFGIDHTSFMRENPSVLPYPPQEIKAFSKKLPWYIIVATGLIVLDLIFVVLTNYDNTSIPNGFNKNVWEHVTVGIFLSTKNASLETCVFICSFTFRNRFLVRNIIFF